MNDPRAPRALIEEAERLRDGSLARRASPAGAVGRRIRSREGLVDPFIDQILVLPPTADCCLLRPASGPAAPTGCIEAYCPRPTCGQGTRPPTCRVLPSHRPPTRKRML